MEKSVFILLAVLGIVIVGIFSLKLLSNEDDWLCVKGQWVKHGNPSAPMPSAGCGEKIESPRPTPTLIPAATSSVNEETESKEISSTCSKIGTDYKMNLSEAKEIAQKSDCVQEGQLKEDSFCNENTGTWWINMEVSSKPGCAPACVIDVVIKKAEINWRCTGLVP